MKTTTNYTPVAISAVATLLIIAALLFGINAKADVTTFQKSNPGEFKTYTFFATSTVQTRLSTTTTATSTNINSWTNSNGEIDNGYFVTAGAKKVTFYFKRGDTGGTGNSGTTDYRVQVTNKVNPTESDWIYYNKLEQNLSTSTVQTLLGTLTITAATSTVLGSTGELDSFYAVRCIVVETTDGEHSCSASASY